MAKFNLRVNTTNETYNYNLSEETFLAMRKDAADNKLDMDGTLGFYDPVAHKTVLVNMRNAVTIEIFETY